VTQPVGNSAASEPAPLSPLTLATVVLRHRWLITLLTLGGIITAAASIALSPRVYTATTLFMPQSRSMSQQSSFFAQIGLQVAPADVSDSPQFYTDLLRTWEILDAVSRRQYTVASGRDSVTRDLGEWLGIVGPRGVRDERVREALRSRIETSVSSRTGVITLRTTMPNPSLAAQVAGALLDELSLYNRERRRSRAVEERRFTEQRLGEARAELRSAEDRLQSFLQVNREYRSSPRLAFDQDRLSRDVIMRQEVYNSVAKAYEAARVEEIRDLPVLTVLERPRLPVSPSGMANRKKLVLGLALGLLVGLLVAVLREYVRTARTLAGPEYSEFAQVRRDVATQLSRPLSRVRRLMHQGE
jgi:uncharacterized protein involved in exopolysaccharide biosynthesis